MQLKDLERSGRGTAVRYRATIRDDLGASDYELSISGTSSLITESFAKSDFEILISPRAEEKAAQSRALEMWQRHSGTVAGGPETEDLRRLFKNPPPLPTPTRSIVVAVRRTKGKGTFWAAWFPALFVPRGVSLFFALPPVCTAFATLFPLSGDPDLFLHPNSPTAPAVAASAGAGLARDSVSFGPWACWPWNQFVPFYRVFGFLPSVTGVYFGGHGIP